MSRARSKNGGEGAARLKGPKTRKSVKKITKKKGLALKSLFRISNVRNAGIDVFHGVWG
jgi:hypothetical protein